ncbi:MAG: methyltransferase [Candidatus Liptonbacteria bacterium]|nr:methyltransferase [Candidatus Liptonbacteria bacterium]
MENKNTDRDLGFLLRDKYKGNWQKEFLEDAERVKKGEPLDFVIGWTPFLNCKIDLSFRPLIPRPETEYWTEIAIKEIKRRKQPKVLDIFSGSGAIGIAVLKNIKDAKVDFGEFEPSLVKQIKLNLRLNKISPKRYKVFCSDVFKNICGKYEFILANPPYIPLARKSKVHPAAIKYERKSSLFGGKDGLFFASQFLAGLKQHLLPGGEAWMEFDSPEKSKIKKLIKGEGLISRFQKDQYGKWRYAVISNILER